jgi:hypothetical protein
VIYFLDRNTSCVETVSNRLGGKPGAVLHTVKAFLFNGGNQLTVFHERRGSVTVICVYSKDVHRIADFGLRISLE